MHVIYFFIILAIVNIAMFLLLTQCLGYYKNKSETIRGLIIVGSCLIFTVISALIYSGMVGWNCTKENYEWNLNQGFKVSPLRKKCMGEGVCRNSENYSKNSPGVLSGNCSGPTQNEMTTLNFPPRLSKNCMVNPDEEDYGGCRKWTVGWNGNRLFPMTYSNWIDNSDPEEPINWPRPDATSNSVGYFPPTASCVSGIHRPQPPNTDYTMPWESYSTLGQYAQSNQRIPRLPMPGGSLREQYTPTFLNCSGRIRKK